MDLALALRDKLAAASVEEVAWPDLLMTLADGLHAREATLGGGSTWTAPLMVAPRTDPSRIDTYLDTYHQQNAIMRELLGQAPGHVVSIDGLAGIERFRRSDFYNGWCVPQGFRHAFGFTLRTLSGWNGALVVNSRDETDGAGMATLQALVPLLARALETSQLVAQIRVANRTTLNLLEQAGKAALLLDRHGQIVDVNDQAEAMMLDGRLTLKAGRIAGLDRPLARCLARPDLGGGEMVLPGGLLARWAPFPTSLGMPAARRPVAVVIISDPEGQLRQRLDAMRVEFGLTPAEAQLALALVRTGSRKAAAELRNVSDTTARAQLSSIFDKTGVRRQTDLITLLMRGS